VKSIESSLKKGASLTQPDEHGNTPLHVRRLWARKGGGCEREGQGRALGRGPSNETIRTHFVALVSQVAAMYGACHAIAYLHAQGADLSVRNRAGHDHTPPKI